MYLELSERASGKTTRLIKAVISYLNRFPCEYAVVASHSLRLANFIANSIERSHKHLTNRLSVMLSRDAFINRTPHKRFIDEFYYIEGLVIKDSDYLVGTEDCQEKKTREQQEQINKAIIMNGYNYTRFVRGL